MPTRHKIPPILFYGSLVTDCSRTQNNLHGRLHTTKTHLCVIKSNFLEILTCADIIGQDNIYIVTFMSSLLNFNLKEQQSIFHIYIFEITAF